MPEEGTFNNINTGGSPYHLARHERANHNINGDGGDCQIGKMSGIERRHYNPMTQQTSSRQPAEDLFSPRIVEQHPQFLASVSIQSGLRLTPRAEAELMRRRSPRSPKTPKVGPTSVNHAPDQHHIEDSSLNVLCSPRLGLVSLDFPVMTSTPSKDRTRVLVRSEGLDDLGAAARGAVSELSSEERELREEVEEEERRMRADLKLHCPPTPVKVRTPRRLLPSSSGQHQGQPHILAEQIDSEIVELRNFFEDHREEMMSLLHGEEERNTSLPAFPHHRQMGERSRGVQQQLQKSRSMHFIPQAGEEEEEDGDRDSTPPPLPNPYSLPYHQYGGEDWNRSHERLHHGGEQGRIDRGLRKSQQLIEEKNQGSITNLKKEESIEVESESDAVGPDRTLLLRRREFEKRRLRNRERRKKAEVVNSEFDHSNSSANNNNNISSFFPVPNNTGGDPMVHVPRLNLESVCSDVTLPTSHSLDASLASHTEDIFGLRQRQEEPLTRRRGRQKQPDSNPNLSCNQINSTSPTSTHGKLSSRNRSKRKSKVRRIGQNLNLILPGAC